MKFVFFFYFDFDFEHVDLFRPPIKKTQLIEVFVEDSCCGNVSISNNFVFNNICIDLKGLVSFCYYCYYYKLLLFFSIIITVVLLLFEILSKV